MNPNFNSVWSAPEINMMNSLITSHIANNTYTNNQHVVASRSAIVNHNNFGMPTEVVPPVDNMDMMQGYLMDDTDAMRLVQGQQHMPNVVPNQRRHAVKFWTTDEHRNFLRGLEVFGRGKWKNISKYFVPTRTPVQISSHAQKYFRRQECTTEKQRFSINDVGLYDTQPWVRQNNSSSSWEALTFTAGRAYNNTNYCAFNSLPYASSQASNNQVATWITDQQATASSSIAPPATEESQIYNR
ncbi:myb-like protein J [Zea mays]|uniref:Myb protein1 n=1 Tax=Zea mays TaxID=4577 RepID=K7V5I7_MAIZE|eukprot:XP_008656502.1 myb-like protein J [Zea mays]